MDRTTDDLGREAEERAARFLQDLGYKLLERSFRSRAGEIDLVVKDGSTLVFVEVKARSRAGFGGPESAVTRAKKARFSKTAAVYLQKNKIRPEAVRFDVIAILDGRLTHLKDAFSSPIRFTI